MIQVASPGMISTTMHVTMCHPLHNMRTRNDTRRPHIENWPIKLYVSVFDVGFSGKSRVCFLNSFEGVQRNAPCPIVLPVKLFVPREQQETNFCLGWSPTFKDRFWIGRLMHADTALSLKWVSCVEGNLFGVVSKQGCGIQGFLPTSVIQGNPPL